MYSRAQKAVSRRSTPKAGSASRNASGANPKVQSSRPRRASSSGDRVKILKARDVSDEQNRFSHINVSLRIRPKQGRRQTSYQHQDGSKFIEFRVQQKNTKSKFVGLDNDRAAARKKFVFSCPKIFPENSTQEAVFEETSSPVVSKALDGINGTIFTYGQTGSGKTYTLTGGSSYDERGIIPRTIESYFRTIRARQKANHQIQCTVSYVEVYNEHIFDLLNPENKGKKLEDWTELKLRENSGDNSVGAAGSSSRPQTPSSHGTSDTSGAKDQANNRMSFEVVGLQEVIVQSEEEAINLLFMGNVNRVTSETPMNNASSRSHCIFTLKLRDHNLTSGMIRCSTLRLVDLAGSERLYRRKNNSITRTEGRYINLSLHHLEQVIFKLSTRPNGFVSFRNSKLTAMVSDTLGGNSNTTFIATINPEEEFGLESISTCKFVHRCSLVKQDAHTTEFEDLPTTVLRLQRENGRLRGQLGQGEPGGTESVSISDNTQTGKQLVQKLSLLDTEAAIKQCIEDEVTTFEFAKQCIFLLQQQVRRGGKKPTGPDVYDWFPESATQAPLHREKRTSMQDARTSGFAPAPAPALSSSVKTPPTSPQRYASTPLHSHLEADGVRRHPQSSALRSEWSASGQPASATSFEFGSDAKHHRSLYEAASPIRGATAAYNASILLNMRNQKHSHQQDARPLSDGMYEPASQAQAQYRSPPRRDTWKGSAFHKKSSPQVRAGESRPDADVFEPEQSSSLAGMSTSEVLRAGQVYEMHEENGARPATMIWCSQDLRSLLWRRVAEETVCGALPISEIVDIRSFDDDDSGERCYSIRTHLSDIRLASMSEAHDFASSKSDCEAYCTALRALTGMEEKQRSKRAAAD
eukprot:INCI17857.1.p1 GENE.INCI17857.1~~INCI17857.1.p1  ORF type:complete len:885 (+),score=121.65 INCI17857.1:61-2655(+)